MFYISIFLFSLESRELCEATSGQGFVVIATHMGFVQVISKKARLVALSHQNAVQLLKLQYSQSITKYNIH